MRFSFVFRAVLVAGILAVTGPVWAAANTPSMAGLSESIKAQDLFDAQARQPEIQSIPALANLVRNGAKLYYLGERSGMHGWFILQDNRIQMIYLSPDRKTVLIGAMFTVEGENVTTPQISILAQNNRDINNILNGASRDQQELIQAGKEGGAASVASDKAAVEKTANSMFPSAPLSPGERLMQDLKAAASVVVGKDDTPELIMVVAPGCPNCKKTWQEMRDSVMENKIHVRLVPAYNSTGGEEKRVAAQLLRVADPLTAWDKYVAGDVQSLAGMPDELAFKAIQANMGLVAKWNIQGFPYMVYRGQDGRIKIVMGKPERMAAVLADLRR